MGLFAPDKRTRHRRFSYEPRFYDPSHDERLKKRIRIQSQTRRRRKPLGVVYFTVLLIMAIYIYTRMG